MMKNKNYYFGVLHGVFFFAANALIDYSIVLPTFLKYLINSNALIGFVSAIARGGTIFFQLISAAYLEGKKKRPILIKTLWVRFLCWVFIAVSSYVLLPEHKLAELLLFVVLISIFSFAGGVASIPFYDIIMHNIPSKRLGKFWATRQFIGGLLAVGSGYVVKIIMKNIGYPSNYTLLFALASIVFALSFISLGSMEEGAVKQKLNPSFGDFLSNAILILKNNRDFLKMVISEFLSHSIFMCMPFIAIYTIYKLGLNKSDIGYFISAQMVGSILSNFFWGYFADKKGSKFIIITTNILALSVPLLSVFVHTRIMFIAVFFLLGSYMHGSFIGYTNYMLNIAPAEKRPTFVSIRGTFNALSYFLPAIGGAIIDKISYQSLFIMTSFLSFIGLLYAFRLKSN